MLYRLVKPSFHKYDVQDHLLPQCIEYHSIWNKEYKPNMYACLFSYKGIFLLDPSIRWDDSTLVYNELILLVESTPGISPRVAHRTVRDTLASYGSSLSRT